MTHPLPSEPVAGLLVRKQGTLVFVWIKTHLSGLRPPARAKTAVHLVLLAGVPKVRHQHMARTAAAAKAKGEGCHELAESILSMILKDCRKNAADKAESAEDAQRLLQHGSMAAWQHGSMATTMRHYRTRPDVAKPVR